MVQVKDFYKQLTAIIQQEGRGDQKNSVAQQVAVFIHGGAVHPVNTEEKKNKSIYTAEQ
jgi:hypothetical protein